jgi:hypothetical protein
VRAVECSAMVALDCFQLLSLRLLDFLLV